MKTLKTLVGGISMLPVLVLSGLILPVQAQTDPSGFKWLARSKVSKARGAPLSSITCVPQQIETTKTSNAFTPCVSDFQRAVPMGNGRYLVYGLNTKVFPPFELEVTKEAKPSVLLKPHSGPVLELPLEVKRAVFNNAHDIRAWPINERDYDDTSQQHNFFDKFGVPTDYGLVTSRSIFSKYLSSPGNAISTAEDSYLSKLFDNSNNDYSLVGARLGTSAVVIKDTRQPVTRLALFDAKTQKLEQNLQVKGIEDTPAYSEDDRHLEYVFNDNQNQLYLLKGRSGKVYAIDEKLQARLIGRLPELVGQTNDQCGESRVLGRVLSAIKLPTGNLLMSAGGFLLLQQGQSFFSVPAPRGVVQIIPVSDSEVVVIASAGLAQITLPTAFSQPSRISMPRVDAPGSSYENNQKAQPCGK